VKYLIKIVSIFSVALLTNVAFANPMMTQTLFNACKAPKDSPAYGACLGFIGGVANSALPATQVAMIALGGEDKNTIMKAAEASGRVFGCGEGFTIVDTINHYIEYIDKNPNEKTLPAVFTLTRMMAKKYQCN